MQWLRVGTALLVALSTTAAMTACGSGDTDAAGGAPSSSSTAPAPPIVSADKLDVGKIPTAPRPPLGTAGQPGTGVVVDAQHMADYVVGPWEVDEAIVTPYLSGSFLLNGAQGLEQLGPTQIAAAAGKHAMINGFASARQETDKKVLVNAVLRFGDPEAAKAAAADMNSAAQEQPIQGKKPTPTTISGHDDAQASTYPFTARGSNVTMDTIRSFTPHGPYVLMQLVQSADGLEAAADLVGKTVDAQGPAIDEFTPTAPNELANVPLDPTGLLARTIPGGTDTALTKNAVYTTRGALHFQSNPVGSKKLFDENGVDAVAMAQTNVYQAKDEAAAAHVADSFGVEVSTDGVSPADAVPNLPESRCLKFPSGFYCVAPAGRYAIEVQSPDLTQSHQLVAAQYVMLTAPR